MNAELKILCRNLASYYFLLVLLYFQMNSRPKTKYRENFPDMVDWRKFGCHAVRHATLLWSMRNILMQLLLVMNVMESEMTITINTGINHPLNNITLLTLMFSPLSSSGDLEIEN